MEKTLPPVTLIAFCTQLAAVVTLEPKLLGSRLFFARKSPCFAGLYQVDAQFRYLTTVLPNYHQRCE